MLRRIFAGLLVLVVALLSACASGSTAPSLPQVAAPPGEHELTKQDVEAWLDGFMPNALNEAEAPGAVVAVVKDGEVLTTRGYGYAKFEEGTEPTLVDPNWHMFRWASISKIPTAIAVMQLVEQGRLDLDTDISAYTDTPIKRAFDEDITLRHLLTHTAGFEDWGGDDVTVDPPQQVFRPGTTPGYSNYSSMLAGHIVAEVSGQPFVEYVKQHVLEPAGMGLATYQDSPFAPEVQERLATGDTETDNYALSNNPSGSLTGSGADAARFLLAQLERSPKLLRAETWEQMWRAGLGEESFGALAQAEPMGLGYFTGERNGHRFVGHGGDVPGFHSNFEIYPDDRVGIFVSVNGDGKDLAGADIRDVLPIEFAQRYLPGERYTGEVDPEQAQQQAEAVAGQYVGSRTFTSTFLSFWATSAAQHSVVALGDGRIEYLDQEYEPVGSWQWRQVDGDTRIAAVVVDQKVVQVGSHAITLVPVTLTQQLAVPVLISSLALIVVVVLIWPVGALLRWRARGQGLSDPGRLPWLARAARIGAISGAVAVGCWSVLVTVMFNQTDPTLPDVWGRPIQVLQWIGVVAVVPAVWDLVNSVRSHSGWRRITVAALLVAGLLGLTWWAWTGMALAPDISV